MTLEQLWGLAVSWYSNRLTPEARRPMGDEVRAIFDDIGLTDPFWSPAGSRTFAEDRDE